MAENRLVADYSQLAGNESAKVTVKVFKHPRSSSVLAPGKHRQSGSHLQNIQKRLLASFLAPRTGHLLRCSASRTADSLDPKCKALQDECLSLGVTFKIPQGCKSHSTRDCDVKEITLKQCVQSLHLETCTRIPSKW